jgi:serine/threonine-protein kinase
MEGQRAGDGRETGKYQIVEPLKRGGTAAIYLAVMRGENRFSREVVIKRPLPHLVADRRLRSMFIDEAHIASRLSHPNIVQVIDLVAREDEIYLVLEYLKGRDLRELLRRSSELGRKLPIDVSVWIAAEMCAGLDFAHNAADADGRPLNLVHRDVSPKNVRITDRGAVKLIDFGIARVEHRITETAPGSVKGTLGYMSPEQVMGEEVDRRCDVFSAGICLFQMLTARNPFDADNLQERVQRLVHSPIPKVAEFTPEIDSRLEQIVQRFLERDLQGRYQTAGEAQRDLEAYYADLSLASPRQRAVELLEEMFPDIHENHPRLKELLTTLSGLEESSEELMSWGDAEANTAISSRAEPLDPTARDSAGAWSAWADPPAPPPMTHGLDPDTTDASVSGEAAKESGAEDRRQFKGGLAVGLLLAGVVLLAAGAWTIGRFGGEPDVIEVVSSGGSSRAVEPEPEPPESGETRIQETKARPKPRKSRPRVSSKTGPSPRDYFKAGSKRAKDGEPDEAVLLYTLAYAGSGSRVNPAIYRNLALAHESMGQPSKVRACFNMYLSVRPSASDAGRIRALLDNYPPAPSVDCVSRGEIRAAKKRAGRIGAKLQGWLDSAD